ncbi:tripartite tricarboxylate transporter substrate binding protein [Roseomonas sp. WA12]
MDVMARLLASRIAERLRQPVVIENRPGAGGNVGSEIVARAAADGQVMMIMGMGHAVNVSLYPELPFDPIRDFEPVSLVAHVPNVLVVHSGVRAQSLTELLAFAKANPGRLSHASTGTGSSGHLCMEVLKSLTGIDVLDVPYRGSGPALNDLLAGQVDMMFDSVTSAMPQIQIGAVRALGVSSTRRSLVLPAVPTMSEGGIANYDVSPWFAVFLPARTPRAIVNTLNEEIADALSRPDIRARFSEIGAEPAPSSARDLADYVRHEVDRWAALVRAQNIKAN